jgi:hypothetical protein
MLALFGLTPLLAAQDKATDPKIVKFDELKKAIAEQKGKVLVIDFWADT